MNRRGFFGRLSALLAFFGVGAASRSARASLADGVAPTLVWQPVDEPAEYHHYETSLAGTTQVIEILEGVHRDWRYAAKITYCHPLAGPSYVFEVEVDWDDVEPHNSARHRARSWGSDLKEVRARAELAVRLLLDVRRVEAVGMPGCSPWSAFRLLSSR